MQNYNSILICVYKVYVGLKTIDQLVGLKPEGRIYTKADFKHPPTTPCTDQLARHPRMQTWPAKLHET